MFLVPHFIILHFFPAKLNELLYQPQSLIQSNNFQMVVPLFYLLVQSNLALSANLCTLKLHTPFKVIYIHKETCSKRILMRQNKSN